MMWLYALFALCSLLSTSSGSLEDYEERTGVKFASECEICKLVSLEVTSLLAETANSHAVIETSGYSFDQERKKTKFVRSELRLVEVLESVCEGLMEYRTHPERKDLTRFARGTNQYFQMVNKLVSQGVKMNIGAPPEMWDKPTAEIVDLKYQCEILLGNYDEVIENWYFKDDPEPLEDYLCRHRALLNKDKSCLEPLIPEKEL